MNTSNGTVIHGGAGQETNKLTKQYLYENSQYATPNSKVVQDSNGLPLRIIRKVATAETGFKIITILQDVKVVNEVSEPKEVKTVPQKPPFPVPKEPVKPLEENLEKKDTVKKTDKPPKRIE
jgi:hypothetical protein